MNTLPPNFSSKAQVLATWNLSPTYVIDKFFNQQLKTNNNIKFKFKVMFRDLYKLE
jgi:hypothetical protein